ncbi:hypothetical protein AVEN_123456-1, partial [Araneus ventricosus]
MALGISSLLPTFLLRGTACPPRFISKLIQGELSAILDLIGDLFPLESENNFADL